MDRYKWTCGACGHAEVASREVVMGWAAHHHGGRHGIPISPPGSTLERTEEPITHKYPTPTTRPCMGGCGATNAIHVRYCTRCRITGGVTSHA